MARAGLRSALSGDYDMAILDVMLPKMNGFDVLRNLPEESKLPVIMLTASGDDMERIVGLEIGADDICQSHSIHANLQLDFGPFSDAGSRARCF